MWLFDSSFLIDLMKHDPGAIRKAREVDETAYIKAISAVTVHEVLRGFFYLGNREKIRLAESVISKFEVIPYTPEIARKSAEIDAELIKTGEAIPFSDIAIATTAIFFDLTLVTRDEHFRRIRGLRIEEY